MPIESQHAGAQRFSMYGDAASGVGVADKACQPYAPNYLMFQFGMWGLVEPSVAPALGLPPNPLDAEPEVTFINGTNVTTGTECGSRRRLEEEWSSEDEDEDGGMFGRRLQRRGGGRGGKKQSAAVDYMLLAALGDQVTSFLAILFVVIFFHEFLLFIWAHALNRKFYRAVREEEKKGIENPNLPKFRALPTSLVFPRFHVTLFTVVVTGGTRKSRTLPFLQQCLLPILTMSLLPFAAATRPHASRRQRAWHGARPI